MRPVCFLTRFLYSFQNPDPHFVGCGFTSYIHHLGLYSHTTFVKPSLQNMPYLSFAPVKMWYRNKLALIALSASNTPA